MLVTSRYFFADPTADVCRRLVKAPLRGRRGSRRRDSRRRLPCADRIRETATCLPRRGREDRPAPPGSHDGHRAPYNDTPNDLPRALRDGVEGWRVERHGPVFSTWEIVHELPGRIRFRNRLIRRDAGRCAAIDAALARVAAASTVTSRTRSTATVLDPSRPEDGPPPPASRDPRSGAGRARARGRRTPLGRVDGEPARDDLGRGAYARRQGDAVVHARSSRSRGSPWAWPPSATTLYPPLRSAQRAGIGLRHARALQERRSGPSRRSTRSRSTRCWSSSRSRA